MAEIEQLSGTVRHATTLDNIIRRPHVTYELFRRHGLMGPTPAVLRAEEREAEEEEEEAAREARNSATSDGAEAGDTAEVARPRQHREEPPLEAELSVAEAECVEVELKYEGFLQRQRQQMEQVSLMVHGVDPLMS